MEIQIREYMQRDYISLVGLSQDEWKPAVTLTAKSLINGTNNVEKCLVALYQGNIIGFIYGFFLPNKTILPEFLYVISEYRKQGIAAALLLKFEKLYSPNVSMIFYNKSLHDYYSHLGYEVGDELEVAIKMFHSESGGNDEI